MWTLYTRPDLEPCLGVPGSPQLLAETIQSISGDDVVSEVLGKYRNHCGVQDDDDAKYDGDGNRVCFIITCVDVQDHNNDGDDKLH